MTRNLFDGNIDTSIKRKEDLTVAELKSLKWFEGKSEEELEAIIEFAKVFTGAMISIYQNEQDSRQKTKKIIASQKSKAA